MAYPPMNLDSKIKFGKYIGHTLLFLIDNEYRYVAWLIDEKIILLTDVAYEYFSERGQ